MGLNRKVSGSGMAVYCELKFNLLGDLGVGKTSMVLRFTHHMYTDNVAPTSGKLNFTLCNSIFSSSKSVNCRFRFSGEDNSNRKKMCEALPVVG